MINAEILTALAELGLDGPQLSAVIKIVAKIQCGEDERKALHRAAQAKYRNKNKNGDITGISLSDHSPSPKDPVLNSDRTEDSQNPSPLLSPRPAKSKSDWPVDGFEAHWWPIYPRKTAKGTARKVFDRIRRDGRVPWAELMAGTHRFAQFPPEQKFIPHPATWLNAEQWSDEPAAINSGANGSDFSRSGADQIISAAHRRIARLRSGGRSSSEGSFDFNGNAEADDNGSRSAVIDHDGQAPGNRSNGGDFSALLFSSPSRIARSF